MMMAQPFPAHQGIPQHPGLPPGHHMGPGQHPTHPTAGLMQQMHPGVSAPGAPQVSQAGPMMAGMPTGAATAGPGGPVPNAHALSHLGPSQAHLFQQQQFQNFANNPQLLHQQQQQQHQQLLRQRLMLQQQQQQQQHGGLPVSLPNGTQGLSAAQLAAMQSNNAMRLVNPQMHMQQQMPHGQPQNLQVQQQQQLFAIQQVQQQAQQAHQTQQAQQANNAAQSGQQTSHQRAASQVHGTHDAQSLTPQPQPGPPPPQGSATPQQGNPPPQPPSTQPQQQPGLPRQQPTPNPHHQQLSQNQPGAQQQQQHSQSQQQPGQQHPQAIQPGQPQLPQHQPMTAQEAQLKAQQHQNNAAMFLQQQRMAMKGATILCLNAYAEHLSNFISRGEAHDLLYWQQFVEKFYSPGGVLRQGVFNHQAGSKQFEISTPALARYYLTQYTSGIKQIQMLVEGARERDTVHGGHFVESPRCSFIYWFTNDCQLFTTGTLRAQFDVNSKIEMLDVLILDHNELIPRRQLQTLEPPDPKESPKMTKNMTKRGQQKQAQQSSITLPESMINANGVPTAVMSFLEVAETMSHMQMLFQYSQQHPQLSPTDALRHLVTTLHAQNASYGFGQAPMNPAMQQGQNPRLLNNMQPPSQFASPAMAQLGLSGAQPSPHLAGSAQASPAQSHLPGPPGMAQQGQLQQNAPIASANSSPSVNNKRRRASTVKVEIDDANANAEVNGTAVTGAAPAKVKASPKVGGKRQKNAA